MINQPFAGHWLHSGVVRDARQGGTVAIVVKFAMGTGQVNQLVNHSRAFACRKLDAPRRAQQ